MLDHLQQVTTALAQTFNTTPSRFLEDPVKKVFRVHMTFKKHKYAQSRIGKKAVLLFLVPVLVTVTGGLLLWWLTSIDFVSSSSAPVGRITMPSSNSVVPSELNVAGTAGNIREGHQVWTVVEVEGDYYPQAAYPLLPDGRWAGIAYIGDSDDAGKIFVLHLVEAGPIGIIQFKQHLIRGEMNNYEGGIQTGTLASDIKPLHSITLIRQ